LEAPPERVNSARVVGIWPCGRKGLVGWWLLQGGAEAYSKLAVHLSQTIPRHTRRAETVHAVLHARPTAVAVERAVGPAPDPPGPVGADKHRLGGPRRELEAARCRRDARLCYNTRPDRLVTTVGDDQLDRCPVVWGCGGDCGSGTGGGAGCGSGRDEGC